MIKHLYNRTKDNIMAILAFEVLYKLTGSLIVMAVVHTLFRLSMSITSTHYITNDNIVSLIKNPLFLFFMFMIYLLICAYILIEIGTLIMITYEDDFAGKIKSPFLLALRRLKPIIQPKNYILLALLTILMPFNIMHLSPNLISNFKVPSFIMSTIEASPSLLLIYLFILLILFYISFKSIFVFHSFFIKKNTAINAFKESYQLTHKHFFKIFKRLFFYNLLLSITLGILLLLINGLVLILIYICHRLGVIYILLISLFKIVKATSTFAYGSVVMLVNILMISHLYRALSGEHIDLKRFVLKEDKGVNLNAKIKKWLIVTFVFTLFVNALLYYFIIEDKDYLAHLYYSVDITAHRGSASTAPENSLSALKMAIEQKADYAEIDVKLTADNAVVLFHDKSLKRMAGESVKVVETPLKVLQQYDIGSHFSDNYKGEHIPTLDEALALCKGKLKLNIELKPDNNSKMLAKKVHQMIVKHNAINEVIISSLDPIALKEIAKYKPYLKKGLVLTVAVGDFIQNNDYDFYSIETSFVSQDIVDKIHDLDKEIHVWTINEIEDLDKIKDMGVDNIITDYPYLIKSALVQSETGALKYIQEIIKK